MNHIEALKELEMAAKSDAEQWAKPPCGHAEIDEQVAAVKGYIAKLEAALKQARECMVDWNSLLKDETDFLTDLHWDIAAIDKVLGVKDA